MTTFVQGEAPLSRRLQRTTFENTQVVRVPDFLPADEHQALLTHVCNARDSFRPPGVEDSPYNGSLYLYAESWQPDDSRGSLVNQLTAPLCKRLTDAIPVLLDALDIPRFQPSAMEPSILLGQPGHLAQPHTDDMDGRNQLTLVYYFHHTPRVFTGGDLELYAAAPDTPQGYSDQPEARIPQQDNLLVAFPSDQYHGVTAVESASERFEDGRFAVIFFFGPSATAETCR